MKIKQGVAVDSIILTLVKFMTMGVSIIITMLLSKKLSLLDYGTYSQANLIISLATSFSICGLTDGVNYFYNSTDKTQKKKEYINTIFLIQIVLGFLCAILILSTQNQISQYFGNGSLQNIYIFIIFSPLLSNLFAMYQVLFISIGKAKIIALRNLYVSVAKLAIVAIACLVTQNVITIFLLLLVSDLLQLAYFMISYTKVSFFINPFRVNFKLIKKIMSYCLPLAVYILTNSLTRDMDKMMVSYFTDTETLAIYTNCSKVLPFDILTLSFATVLIPFITRFVVFEQYEKAQHLYRNYLSFAYMTTWIIAAGAIVVSPELIRFLYSEKYASGLWIFIVYILVDMLRFANVAIILRAKGKTGTLMAYSLASLGLNFILNILFYQLFGIIGPAIATLLITGAMNLTMLIQGSRILKTKVTNLISMKDVAIILIKIVIVGLFAFILRKFLNLFNLHYLLVLFISYGSYLVILGTMYYKKIIKILKQINSIRFT